MFQVHYYLDPKGPNTNMIYNRLELKSESPNSDLMLCTKDKTFRVREAYHSNSLFVATQKTSAPEYTTCNDDALILLDNIPAIWETQDIDVSSIQLPSSIPSYTGCHDTLRTAPENDYMTRESLSMQTPLSEKQFDDLWRNSVCVELDENWGENGKKFAFKVDEDTIRKVLSRILVITETRPSEFPTDKLFPKELHGNMGHEHDLYYEEPLGVVDSVLRRFSKEEEERKEMK